MPFSDRPDSSTCREYVPGVGLFRKSGISAGDANIPVKLDYGLIARLFTHGHAGPQHRDTEGPTMQAQKNEWSDPYPVQEEDRKSSPKEQRTTELQQELVSTSKQTQTTTPLDSRTAFHTQQLDERADNTYYLRTKRFVGRRPAGTYTGTAEETGSDWNVTFDDNPHFIHRLIGWFKSSPDMLGCLQ